MVSGFEVAFGSFEPELDSIASGCYTQRQSKRQQRQLCAFAQNNSSSANRRAMGLVELCLSFTSDADRPLYQIAGKAAFVCAYN